MRNKEKKSVTGESATVAISKDTSINEEVLLQQWQTCVDIVNSISQRRDAMNNLFVTLNLAVFGAVSIIGDIKSLLLSAAGIAVCIVWSLYISNYQTLKKAKFDVIIEIEKLLPYSPFIYEWEILKKNKRFHDSTTLEIILPIAFIIMYGVTLVINSEFIAD